MGKTFLPSRVGFWNEDLQGNLRIFDQMEISEQVYEVKSPSKTIIRSDANCDSNLRNRNEGEATSPTNPDKVCARKRKAKKCSISEQEYDQCK